MNQTAVTRRAHSIRLRRLVESAMMLAIATVLSMFPFQGPWALGGGITVCSMLPLVEELYDNEDDKAKAMNTYTAFF